jgi:hypothetical protein
MAASQAHVARIEQKTDMLLSTLQRYVQGLAVNWKWSPDSRRLAITWAAGA